MRTTATRVSERLAPLALWIGSTLSVWTAARLGWFDVHGLAWSPLSCPLDALFGVHCPTCGLGRSLLFAWSLQPAQAWALHPLGPLMWCFSVAYALLALVSPGLPLRLWQRAAVSLRQHRALGIAAVVLYALWGFGRTLPV